MAEIEKFERELRFQEKLLESTNKAAKAFNEDYLRNQAGRIKDTIVGLKLRIEELKDDRKKTKGKRRVRGKKIRT